MVNGREESAARRVDSYDYSNLPMVSGVHFLLKRVFSKSMMMV